MDEKINIRKHIQLKVENYSEINMRYGNDNNNNKKGKPHRLIKRLENLPSTIKKSHWNLTVVVENMEKEFSIWQSKETEKRLWNRRSQAFTCSCYSIMKLKFNSLMFYVYIYLCIICYMLTWKHHISFMQIKSTSKRSLEHAKRIICYFYALCIVHVKPGKASILNYIMGIEKSN